MKVRAGRSSTLTLAIVLAVVLIAAGAFAILYLRPMPHHVGNGGSTQTSLVIPSQILQRVVLARIYQGATWTLSGETPQSVGSAIAKLDPTYVSGLIRLASTDTLSQQQSNDYKTIRSIVLQTSPTAKFDVVLNAQQYSTPDQMLSQMRDINSKIHVDLWFFDFYYEGYSFSPQTIEAAIGYAHSQGQYVGGNVWGKNIPPGSDFVATDDGVPSQFSLDLERVATLTTDYGIPVLVHLNNNPQNGPSTESCVFMNDWSESQRASYVTSLAQGQGSGGYRYMYNVFFPECPAGVAYDSLTDGSMFSTLTSLMSTYNG